jgi:hypothetical protein
VAVSTQPTEAPRATDKLIAALRESGREAEAAVAKARAANAYRNLRGETVADGDAWTP